MPQRHRLPGSRSCSTRQLYSELDVGCADAAGLPIRHGSVPAAIVSGVISLLADVDDLFAELRRVLTVGGRVAMTDLWSATSSTRTIGANTFWSLEDIGHRARAHGFDVQHLAVSDLACGWWSSSASQINAEIASALADVRPAAMPNRASRRCPIAP